MIVDIDQYSGEVWVGPGGGVKMVDIGPIWKGGGVKMRTFPWGILEWGVYFPQYREHYKCEDEDGEGGKGGVII